jgi:hypothetical protein
MQLIVPGLVHFPEFLFPVCPWVDHRFQDEKFLFLDQFHGVPEIIFFDQRFT